MATTKEPRRVLLVEDDEEMLSFLQLVLEKAGLLVMPARSGKTARAWLQSPEKPHTVVLDLGLPDMAGMDLCRSMKGTPETQGIPVIILTAHPGNKVMLEAQQANADLFLTKPVSADDVTEAVMRLATATSANEALRLARGGLTLDPERRRVSFRRKTSDALSPQKFTLLYLLAKHHPNVLDRRFLIQRLGPHDRDREIDVLVSLLRRDLRASLGVNLIETVPGRGYRLQPPAC